MASQPLKRQGRIRDTLYVSSGPALAVPPERRVRPKVKPGHLDDPVAQPSHWYRTAAVAAAAAALGLLAGRFLLP